MRTDQVTRRKTGWYYMYYIFGDLTGPNFRFRKARNGTERVLYMNRTECQEDLDENQHGEDGMLNAKEGNEHLIKAW